LAVPQPPIIMSASSMHRCAKLITSAVDFRVDVLSLPLLAPHDKALRPNHLARRLGHIGNLRPQTISTTASMRGEGQHHRAGRSCDHRPIGGALRISWAWACAGSCCPAQSIKQLRRRILRIRFDANASTGRTHDCKRLLCGTHIISCLAGAIHT
jgi:hypothetical protein